MARQPVDEEEPQFDRAAAGRVLDVVVGVRPPAAEEALAGRPDQTRLILRKPGQFEDVAVLLLHTGHPLQRRGPEHIVAPLALARDPLRHQPVARRRGGDLLDVAPRVGYRANDLLDWLPGLPAAAPDDLAMIDHLDELLLALAGERGGRLVIG